MTKGSRSKGYRKLTEAPERLITRWARPDEVIASGIYGNVTYREWCKREAERMCGDGRNVAIIESECGKIAIEMAGVGGGE